MSQAPVALKRYQSSPASLADCIQACNGFCDLKPSSRVMIKPNLVAWEADYPVAPYGVYTTSRIVEDLVGLLKDFGVKDICIGEGSVRATPDDPGTAKLYEILGYEHLKERYGVTLSDLVDGPFSEHEICGHKLSFAGSALESDFLINLPVLKTHNQTKLSLGLKNLKGLLDMKSRRTCHHAELALDEFVAGLVEVVKPKLTIIDGIFGLERGPFALGRARRMNALVASRDPLSADLVGAGLAGFDPVDVPHLAAYAESQKRSCSLDDLELVGDKIEDLSRKLAWDFDWVEDPQKAGPPQWEAMGISGLSYPKYDSTLCTGCSAVYNPLVLLFTSAFKGEPFDKIQVLTGKKMRPAKNFNHTLLVGNCMVKLNRQHADLGQAIILPGCPPTTKTMLAALEQLGLKPDPNIVSGFRHGLVERYKNKSDFDPQLFYFPAAPIPNWL
jgi:uncharacterized protein (DUF362 family)